MKLLLDQNLSYKLAVSLSAAFPGVAHVRDHGLTQADDEHIWSFAQNNGFAVVSKDTDFLNRALLRGHPPKVIHLRVGNCPTDEILQLLHQRRDSINAFLADAVESVLIIQ